MKKIGMSKYTNLLECDLYDYTLQNVEKPELFRETYGYGNIPKITFNYRHVPMSMPKEIHITDTTFRDGQQSREPYTIEQIVDIFKLLHKLNGTGNVINQSEFFVYSKRDRDALYKCQQLGFRFPEITTWIRASEKDFDLVKELNISESGILMSCSDYHIFKKMKMNRKQVLEKYCNIVYKAIEHGIKPRCHFEDITRADFYGFVVPLATELMKISKESNVPVKIRACDTMGMGVSIPGVSLPRSVPGILYGLQHYAGVPSELLEWHGHNDFYKGVINATTAWLYGAGAVNCSLLGIGERTGNIPLEAMVFEYASLKGTLSGMDTIVITELAEYFRKEIGYDIPDMTPFVGDSFNSTRAGIHADGLMKDSEIYNIFNTEKILGVPPKVIINNYSGTAGLAYWVNSFFKLPIEKHYQKNDELILRMKKLIDIEYNSGRQTSMSDNELREIYDKCNR